MIEERHSYICTGISKEAFMDMAVRRTNADPDLRWYLHAHPYSDNTCNEGCQLVQNGIVATNVTQMDVASGPAAS